MATSPPNLNPIETQVTSLGVTETPPADGRHTTDVVYQEVRLYIEGVQVPFEAISVSQAMGQLPTAEIQVPPQSGLMDICRYYEPKVHIFYKDLNLGGFRLLFWGHITGSSFMHSRAGSGSASIRFSAVHKNHLLQQVTLDYSGYINSEAPGGGDDAGSINVNRLNSQSSIVEALTGISGVQADSKDLLHSGNPGLQDASTDKLMKSHQQLLPRYKGMPAVCMNFWNQLKKDAYLNPRYNTIMTGMMIPLVEEGISYFKRLSGHTSLENVIDGDRQQYCLHQGVNANVIVPPAFRLNLSSAVQAKMSVEVASNSLQFSGELTDFQSLIESFYYSVGYEMQTLASPSEVPVDPSVSTKDGQNGGAEMMAVETIVKPQLPFYYAPACNVIYPRMFHTIQVSQDESQLPTRVSATHDSMPAGQGRMGTNYRGPHSVREGIAYAASTSLTTTSSESDSARIPDLANTLGLTYHAVGRYEQGRGVKHMKIGLPWWLQLMTQDESSRAGDTNQGQGPDRGSQQYSQLIALMASWESRNGYDITEVNGQIQRVRNKNKDLLNPYSVNSGVYPYQSLLFTSVDYEFTKKMVGAKNGVVECIFNPYIVPGYPLDVLDDSPNHPSFHALCSSVTHNITSRSISTTVGMLAVQTYAELSNYYVAPVPPYLQTTLGMVSVEGQGGQDYGSTDGVTVKNAGTLLFNAEAKTKADDFYRSTLGVRAADPSTLYDWTTGQILPQARFDAGTVPTTNTPRRMPNGGDANDYNTAVGNLRLVARPIESKDSIQYKFEYSFVDLKPENYNNTVVDAPNPKLAIDPYLEPGASPFLEYMEPADFIRRTQFSNSVQEGLNTSGATPANYVSRRSSVD